MPAWIKFFRVSVAGPASVLAVWSGDGPSTAWLRLAFPFFPQVVAGGASHAILLKFLPLPLAQILTKFRLLTPFSPFCRASTQSLAEVLKQLGASPELQAVLSYAFPTYGG